MGYIAYACGHNHPLDGPSETSSEDCLQCLQRAGAKQLAHNGVMMIEYYKRQTVALETIAKCFAEFMTPRIYPQFTRDP